MYQIPLKKIIPPEVADITKSEGHLTVGAKGAGKSAFGEFLAEYYKQHGYIIFDGLDANDFESLGWAIKGRYGDFYRILLIHPPTWEVSFPDGRFNHIKPMCSDEGLETVLTTAKNEDRVIVMACKLWRYGTVGNVLAQWIMDLPTVAEQLNTPVFLLLREVGHYAFSALKVFPELEDRFKKSLTYVMKEGRHFRIAFFFDLQRAIDLYKAIRVLCDHIHIKRSSIRMLPKELEWVPQEIDKWRDKFSNKFWKQRERKFPPISRLYPREYYSITDADEIHPVRSSRMPTFWHKNPKDQFAKWTNMRLVRTTIPDESEMGMTAEEAEAAWAKRLREEGVPVAVLARTSVLGTPYSTMMSRLNKLEKMEAIT